MLYLAIDCGTTNTRVWLLEDNSVRAKASVPRGVRDTAISGSRAVLEEAIAQAVESVSGACKGGISFAMAAGMITSGLGLYELKHVLAPVAAAHLSEHVRAAEFPRIVPVPIYFVPGVRSGPTDYDELTAADVDLIRGEETEIFGALELLKLRGPLLYVHLGSHTKAIFVDERNRIARGVTTLAGELVHAAQTHTILSECLPAERLKRIDEAMLFAGAEHARRSGLTRALFLVRILDQSGRFRKSDGSGGDKLLSFLVGAVIETDLKAFTAHDLLAAKQQVVLSGPPGLQAAWKLFLERRGLSVRTLTQEQIEASFLAGLRRIVCASPIFKDT